jgi:hypothetical protein
VPIGRVEQRHDLGDLVGLVPDLTPARTAPPQLVPSLRQGSGYEQAKAEFCCVESDEVAVASGPPA